MPDFLPSLIHDKAVVVNEISRSVVHQVSLNDSRIHSYSEKFCSLVVGTALIRLALDLSNSRDLAIRD